MEEIQHRGIVDQELSGQRLDQALARLFSDYSRSRLQRWIKAGRVRVDGEVRKPRDKVWKGEHIVLRAVLESEQYCGPEDIPLDILYEDEHLLVMDKPAGLVVHPGSGNPGGTVQNALLHHDPGLAGLPRAGIVHRLDKDTTGLMVVARSPVAHKRLVEALQARNIKREYLALVVGRPTAGGEVDAPVGRHPGKRVCMAVVPGGKPARTHYRINERFRIHSLLDVRLESGRTHQIRVHMAHIRYPLVGDAVYGGRLKLPRNASEATKAVLRTFPRQALHARRLSLQHPVTGDALVWESPVPADLQALIDQLREDAAEHAG
ncbi:23S rRNA pseudouridine(1911/1915/1917) synthase RluD [Thiolapillus sp.]